MIDNIPENFQLQPNNGFSIITWTNDINDTELYDLKKILNFIYEKKFENVTLIIKKINNLLVNHNKNNKINYSNLDLVSMVDTQMILI